MFLSESYANDFMQEDAAHSDILPDENGMMDLILAAESSFYNLKEKMFRAEHDAVIREDAALLEEAKKSFWVRLKEWVKEQWAKFTAFIRKVWDWVMVRVTNVQKFLNKHGKTIKETNCSGTSVSVSIYPNPKIEVFEKVAGYIPDFDKSGKKKDEDYKKELVAHLGLGSGVENVSSAAIKAFRGSDKKEEKTLDNGLRDKAYSVLTESIGVKTALSSKKSAIDSMYKALLAVAEQEVSSLTSGSTNTRDDIKEASKMKGELVESYKAGEKYGKISLNIALSMLNEGVYWGLTVARGVLRVAKKSTKNEGYEFNDILDMY
jgi:hypothetical protein